MGRLIYAMNVSLDGFVETPDHSLDWATVDEEVHTWFNHHSRALDASIYGRRMYELMSDYWPTVESDPSATDAMRDFGRIWNLLPKVVFSTTLDRVAGNSRLVHGEVGDELARLRAEFRGDLDIGGATLAASFIRRGLVDEFDLVVHPVAIGNGTPYFPALDEPLRLRLVEQRAFASGVALLRYQPVAR